jgi:multidrug efflux pump subunit AcrA (membrane-fusion protein)
MKLSRTVLGFLTLIIIVGALGFGIWLRLRPEGDDADSDNSGDSEAAAALPASASQQFSTDVPQPVVGAEVIRDTLWITVTAAGEAASTRSAPINALVEGVVQEIPVRENRAVVAGDVLLRVDTTEHALNLATAQANLLRAKRQEDEARTGLSYGTLTAPIAGRVVERYADPGDTARQGEPLLRIYDPNNLRLEASVRESVASHLTKGQKLATRIDALGKELEAVVDEIVPSADPGSRSFLVKSILTSTTGLYPGMFGRLLIPMGWTEKTYVPAQAVTRVGQLDFVIVRTEQGPIRRYVRLGSRTGAKQVEVISGLAPGEEVSLGMEQ